MTVPAKRGQVGVPFVPEVGVGNVVYLKPACIPADLAPVVGSRESPLSAFAPGWGVDVEKILWGEAGHLTFPPQ